MIEPRTIEITAPAEAGELFFERMDGSETLGRPFGFGVDVLCKNGDIPIADVLGKPFTVTFTRGGMLPPRIFNGIVTSFALVGHDGQFFRYQAKLRPLLWLLTRTSNCRVFQNMSIPDVVMSIFGARGVTAKKQLGRESYAPWEYFVQYNETDFNFVSRLMEQEGISYYFKHEAGKHTLILIDALTAHDTVPSFDKIPFEVSTSHVSAFEQYEHIEGWSSGMQIEPGVYAAKEYDFEKPRAPLLSTTSAPNPHAHADSELFEYPGHYIDNGERDDYTKRRLEEQQLDYEQSQGSGTTSGIMPGFQFTLTDHPAHAQNKAYLVTGASYRLVSNKYSNAGGDEQETDFRCSFVAIDAKRHFRTPATTPKPHVPGPQTAIVVGPKGEEIWTDKYGRVKVQFPWDRKGEKNEKSSCFVRVSQAWAGAAWGAIHIPRIGQEVIVDFLEGDPDRPIITGRVYNADNMPPYELPGNQTRSGIKSRSTKGGGPANFNELRFEDKKGSEEVYLHAEKDQNIMVEHDETHTVGHDQTLTVDNDRKKDVKHDETTTIGNDRTESVGKDETITIGANRTESVAKDESITISGSRTETVDKEESINVGGGRTLTVGKDDSTSVGAKQTLDVAKDQNTTIGGGSNRSVAKDDTLDITGKQTTSIGKDQTIQVGKKLTITAGDEVTITTGDASISMKKNGEIVIKGKNITLDGSGKVNVKAGGDVIIKGSKIAQN